MFKNSSVDRDYLLFSIIAIVALLIVSTWNILNTIKSIDKARSYSYVHDAVSIEDAFYDSLSDLQNFAKFMGEEIVNTNNTEAKNIGNILKKRSEQISLRPELFIWTLFDFVLPSGEVIASSLHGEIKNPKIVMPNQRSWMLKAPKEPWKLHISAPDIGITSGQYILPCGFGITDKSGIFLGTISVGLNINKLHFRLKQVLANSETSFIILSPDFSVIVGPKKINNEIFTNNLHHQIINANSGMLSGPIVIDGISYRYYNKIQDYGLIVLVGTDLNIITTSWYKEVVPNLVQTIFLGLFLSALLYFFRLKIVSPIVGLARAAEAISKGKTNVQVPHVMNRETVQLARAILYVKRAFLRESRLKAKLHAMNENLEQKVNERTAELKQALNIKTEFLNNISHEVRSPIHGVTVISEELVHGWDRFPEQERFQCIEQIQKSSKRLLSLVNNILDLSSLDQGKMRLKIEKNQDLNVVTKNIIDEITPLAVQKHIKLVLKSKTTKKPEFDQVRIAQVIHNLINNAVKFTSAGTIEINIFEQNLNIDGKIAEAIALSVKDEGVGIPENELETIFTAFTQSTRTKTRAGGTGLGLSICREIINKHNGLIYAENNPNGGACFTFVIPIENSLQLKNANVSNLSIKLQQDDLSNENQQLSVLIVDDEPHCLMSMRMILGRQGYNVLESQGGMDAIEILAEHYGSVKAILLDLMMPQIHGTELLKIIKSDARFKNIPVIIQSGTSDQNEIEQAMEAGAFCFLSKPYSNEEFLAKVRRAIGNLKVM